MIELYKALHEARKAFSTVKKNSTNPHFKSKYADLESILDATEKSLDEKGLLVVTVIKNDNVETSLIHVETGQSIISYYPLNTSLTDKHDGHLHRDRRSI
jgi:precorrin-6B methylase 2